MLECQYPQIQLGIIYSQKRSETQRIVVKFPTLWRCKVGFHSVFTIGVNLGIFAAFITDVINMPPLRGLGDRGGAFL